MYKRQVLSTIYKTERTLEDSSGQNILDQNSYLQSVYAQDKWFISKLLTINVGLRNTYYSETKSNDFTPRLSGSFKVTPSITIEAAMGNYNQYIHQFNSNLSTRGTHGTWLLSSEKVPVISSTSSHSSLYWKNSDYDLSLSYYQRNRDGNY